LAALSKVCRECGLPLFIDGARLGYGLAVQDNDLSLEDIAGLCDVFYIGGTKVGALFGEAVVIINDALKKDFRYFIKQNGGMLAKGRLLGIQFETLFEDGLYYEISKHAVDMAMMIRTAFHKKGFSFRYDSKTNQQFPILPDEVLIKMSEKYSYSFWEKVDAAHSAVRFCTSWATKREHVEMLINDIEAL
jgi:threonine aldolase